VEATDVACGIERGGGWRAKDKARAAVPAAEPARYRLHSVLRQAEETRALVDRVQHAIDGSLNIDDASLSSWER
jgi:hypothetical protein